MQKFRKILLVLCISVFSFQQSKALDVVDLALSYVVCMTCATAHETGHALAMKALYDESCEINVGAYMPGSDACFKIGKVNFKYPLIPCGYVEMRNYGKDHIKDMVILLSGSIAGSLTGFLIYKLLDASCSYETFFNAKGFALGNAVFQYINLFPHPGFDGDHFLQSFKKWRESGQSLSDYFKKREAKKKNKQLKRKHI